MAFFQKKPKDRSSGYFGDLLFPVGDIPAGAAVTLWVLTGEECLLLRRGDEDTVIPYLRLIHFEADNEPRIRDGESRIPAEVLTDVPEKSPDSLTNMQQTVRLVSTRWFGELTYVDEEGLKQHIYMMERKRSGYYLDVVKSLQAIQMEKYFREDLGL